MANIWVMLWLLVTPIEGVEHFQLGTYESLKKCNMALVSAEVLLINTNTQVACVHIGIISNE